MMPTVMAAIGAQAFPLATILSIQINKNIMKSFLCMLMLVISFVALAQDNPSKRLEFGFTTTSGPAAGGFIDAGEASSWKWNRTKSGIELLSEELVKDLHSKSGSMIEAYVMTPDKPFESAQKYAEMVIQNIKEGDARNPKWKSVSAAATPDESRPNCVRVHLLLKAIDQTTDARSYFSEQTTLSCALLKRKPFGIEVRHYHYYIDGERDPQYAAKATKLLDSVEVLDR